MRNIGFITIASPSVLRGHHIGKLDCVQLGIAAVVCQRPGNVAGAEVVALQSKGDMVKVYRAFHARHVQYVGQRMYPHVDGVFGIGD